MKRAIVLFVIVSSFSTLAIADGPAPSGNYVGRCRQDLTDAKSTVTYNFDGDRFIWSTAILDQQCKNAFAHVEGRGRFSVGKPLDADGLIREINFIVEKHFYTPLTKKEAAESNKDRVCGKTNWTAGKRVDISGCTLLRPMDREIYTVYKIDVDTRALYLGDMTYHKPSGFSPESERPRTVEADAFVARPAK